MPVCPVLHVYHLITYLSIYYNKMNKYGIQISKNICLYKEHLLCLHVCFVIYLPNKAANQLYEFG